MNFNFENCSKTTIKREKINVTKRFSNKVKIPKQG